MLFQLLAFGVQVFERGGEDFDEFVVFEFGFEVLVLREGEVDVDVDHVEVSVAEAGVWGCGCGVSGEASSVAEMAQGLLFYPLLYLRGATRGVIRRTYR